MYQCQWSESFLRLISKQKDFLRDAEKVDLSRAPSSLFVVEVGGRKDEDGECRTAATAASDHEDMHDSPHSLVFGFRIRSATFNPILLLLD